MKKSATSTKSPKKRKREDMPDQARQVRSPKEEKRIRSKWAKRKAARKQAERLSAKQLLARQGHRTAVSSVFLTIAIATFLVIALMLFTLANQKSLEIPDIVVYQTAAPDELIEPPTKAKIQLSSSSRPKLPSMKFLQSDTASPVAVPVAKITVPTLDFDIGTDIEGIDFGNGGSGQGGENSQGKKGTLGGMEITAEQLGVVLDISGSMTSVLPTLEKEISKRFPWALTERVRGCQVIGNSELADDPDSTLAAIKFLVEQGEADAIFWFCDLQDTREADAVQSLGKYLRKKKVKLYLSSTSQNPDQELRNAVTKFSRWNGMKK
jgi:hypothetical protein